MRMEADLHGSAGTGEAVETKRSGWEACLQLGFESRRGRTVLRQRRHSGPLTVQRPFYPEDGVCHVYVLHPPGGVVAGDRLDINVSVANGCAALITTPGAGKFYRSQGELARQSVSMEVSGNGMLEWVPQETIVFAGARMQADMSIELDRNSRFIGWEITVFGRPAANEEFSAGSAHLNWRILLGGRLFHNERLRLDAEAFAARWGLNGCSACGTLFAYPSSQAMLENIRHRLADREGLGATLIGEMLILRGLDSRADRLRRYFREIWAILRRDMAGLGAQPPRIWAT